MLASVKSLGIKPARFWSAVALLFSIVQLSSAQVCSRSAAFQSLGGLTIGDVNLNLFCNDSLELEFESNFSSSNGIDVRIYLSPDTVLTQSAVFVGTLQANSGAQSYVVPPPTWINDFPHLILYSTIFNQPWARADFGTTSGNCINALRQGGVVFVAGGGDYTFTCPTSGSSWVQFGRSSLSTAGNYNFIVTDQNDLVQQVVSDSANFNLSPAGVSKVYGISYDGTLNATVGSSIQNASASGCFSLSFNHITVEKDAPEAGSVAYVLPLDTFTTCNGDGNPDYVAFGNLGATADANYRYVVTDQQGLIQSDHAAVGEFDNAPLGLSWVYGIAYTGTLDPIPGTSIFDLESSRCADLSTNFLPLIKDSNNCQSGCTPNLVFGPQGEEVLTLCTGDGVADFNTFIQVSASINDQSLFVFTTETDTILALSPANGGLDLEGYPTGTYRVHAVSYLGVLLGGIGNPLQSIAAGGCEVFSSNFVTVHLQDPDPGTIALLGSSDSTSFCVGDGSPDVLHFDNPGAAETPYVYLITTEEDTITEVLPSDSFDFDQQPPGINRVYGISYSGELAVEPGMHLDSITATNCFEITPNFITTIHAAVDGGLISTTDSLTDFTICSGGTEDPVLHLQTTDTLGTNYAYLLTSDSGLVEFISLTDSIRLSGADTGTYFIYGVSFFDNVVVNVGQHFTEITANDCFEISQNFVSIYQRNCPTSVENPSPSTVEIDVYPNPFKEQITIHFTENQYSYRSINLRLISIDGRILLQREGLSPLSGSRLEVQVPGLNSGIYLLHVWNESITFTQSLIKTF